MPSAGTSISGEAGSGVTTGGASDADYDGGVAVGGSALQLGGPGSIGLVPQ